MRSRTVLLSLVTACPPAAAFAQNMTAQGLGRTYEGRDLAEVQAKASEAIRQWIEDHDADRISSRGGLREGARLQPRYVLPAQQAGFVGDQDYDRLTHLDVLQKMLFFAEKQPSTELSEAVLGVAAAGLEGSLLDRDALELREVGHWTLMRTEHQGTWFMLLRAAAGERVPVFEELRPRAKPEEAVSVGPARRTAALRLIGQRGLPVFRSTLEGALIDADPRVRLAAAESIQPPWRVPTLQRVADALAGEPHPVVSQALVRLLLSMLKRPPEDLQEQQQRDLVGTAFAHFGRAGWRTDMDLLEVVEAFPHKSAIPYLIEALDLQIRSPDALVSAINKRASPLLRERAGRLLRAMTGALVPIDDPAAWREFWAAEQDKIVLPKKLPEQDPDGTRVAFFGVPVTGASIAFLIDTSGSMDAAPGMKGPQTGPRRSRAPGSRLAAAKEQLLLAAQAMAPESQYYVMTFADQARIWTRTPIRPHARNTRSLTELLSRLNPHGGTNLFAGLVAALEMETRTLTNDALPKIDELFVLSDGEPTTGDVQDTETMLELVHAANKYAKVRINTVFTGAGKGSDLLRRLAEENGGVFVQR